MPRWPDPDQRAQDTAELISRNLTQSLALGERKREFNVQQERQDELLRQQQVREQELRAKEGRVASLFQGVDSADGAMAIIAKNPILAVDPDTSGLVEGILKIQGQMDKVRQSTLQGQMQIAHAKKFTDMLSEVDGTTYAKIQGMKPNPNGSPSAEQWTVLTDAVAEARAAIEAERNAHVPAGSIPTVTITDKETGITTRYEMPKEIINAPATIAERTLSDGSVVWQSGPQTFRLLKSGKEGELSATSKLAVAKELLDADPGDPLGKEILKSLAQQATGRGAPAPAAVTGTPPVSTNSFKVGRFIVTPQ